jgi:hypothetical protein
MSTFTKGIEHEKRPRSKKIVVNEKPDGCPSIITIRETCFVLPFDAGYSLHLSAFCAEYDSDGKYHQLIPLALLILGDYCTTRKFDQLTKLTPENKTMRDALYVHTEVSDSNIKLEIFNGESSAFTDTPWLYQFSSATFSSYIMELMMGSFRYFIAVADVSSIVDEGRLNAVATYMRERKGIYDAMKGGVTTMCVYWTRRDNPE